MDEGVEDDRFLSVAEEIVEQIGLEQAEKLLAGYGGTQVYIPKNATEGHWLSNCIGLEDARKLCAHFSLGSTGLRLRLPKGANLRKSEVVARFAKLTDEGLSLDKIALAMNLHSRTISRMRAKLNKRRAKIYRDRIRQMLAEGHKPDAIAKAIGLPLRSTAMVIDLIKEGA